MKNCEVCNSVLEIRTVVDEPNIEEGEQGTAEAEVLACPICGIQEWLE